MARWECFSDDDVWNYSGYTQANRDEVKWCCIWRQRKFCYWCRGARNSLRKSHNQNFKPEINLTLFRAVYYHCNFTSHSCPNLYHSTQGKTYNSTHNRLYLLSPEQHLILPVPSSQKTLEDVLPAIPRRSAIALATLSIFAWFI